SPWWPPGCPAPARRSAWPSPRAPRPACEILEPSMTPALALLITLIMVAANAFFVASEFAFVKIRPTRLQQLAKEGRRRARLLIGITAQLPGYLSASQLGITVASLTLGWLGEPAFAALLRPWLEGISDSETT